MPDPDLEPMNPDPKHSRENNLLIQFCLQILVKLEELVSSPVLEVQERASSALQVAGVANSPKFRPRNSKGTE
jgi:hypothetical protein